MKNEDENDLGIGMNINDVNSDILSKKGLNLLSKKKLIIGISVAFFLIIAIIIILIIIASKKDGNEDDKINYELVTGEILCKYFIETISNEINLVGNEFILDSKMNIYINDKKIKLSKSYKFPSIGEYKIQFIFYNNKINLDYMFKDINTIFSVEMKSNKTTIISSLISTFENCYNLNSFSIKGFNTNEIISAKKLFFNSGLTNINISDLGLNNIEDISYMFASTELKSLDLSKLNTSKVKNMSYMFYNIPSITEIDLSNFDSSNVENMSHLIHVNLYLI